MKRKLLSVLLALVLICSFSLVTAVPAPVMADEGPNYSPFGEVWYIWGANQGTQANVMKWFCLGTWNGGDADNWDGHQITIVNSQWPEFDGQAYLKFAPEAGMAAERFTLWADYDEITGDFSNQVTTEEIGSIGSMDVPAAYAIDGWVDFDPLVDTVGDPRETVGSLSHMYYGSGAGSGGDNLEVKLNTFGAPNSFDGRYLDLVESGWEDINGGWFLKFVLDAGGGTSGWYELYADAGFTVLGIPDDPSKFVPYGGSEGYLYANSGRFVLPYEVWVDDGESDANPGTEVSPFATIQKGIDMVAEGGTVNVAPGTYNQQVTIDVANLTLVSEEFVTEGSTTKDTTLINAGGGAGSKGVHITANGVTVQGFTIHNYENGVYVESTATIDNCIIYNTGVTGVTPWGIHGYLTQASAAFVTITNNEIYDNFMSVSWRDTGGRGIYVKSDESGTAPEVLIDNNEVYGIDQRAICVNHIPATITNNYIHDIGLPPFEGNHMYVCGILLAYYKGTALVQDNRIEGVRYGNEMYSAGIYLYAYPEWYPDGHYGSLTINRNYVDIDSSASGINIYGNARSLETYDVFITNNFITGNTTRPPYDTPHAAIFSYSGRFDGEHFLSYINSIEGNTITGNRRGIMLTKVNVGSLRFNKIYDNTRDGLLNANPGSYPPYPAIDATRNWWGDASGPSGVGPGTTGDSVSDVVDFFPWALDEEFADFTNDATGAIVVDDGWAGFSDYTQVNVEATDYYISVNAFAAIQDGVTAVDTGGTVNVAAGDYTEAVLVDVEGVTVRGESLDAIIDGSFELKADNVTIDGLTIKNGTNKRGIFTRAATGETWGSKGHQIINNELIGPGDTTGYGINIVACAAEPVNILVDNNKMSGWRIAIMLEGYSTTITNNELCDNTKAGIDVERSCDNLISYNSIYNNGQNGVYFGSVATTGNVVVYNNIWANGEYGVLINPESPSTVDATNNWWGNASGPADATRFTESGYEAYGDAVSTNVDYEPWLLAEVNIEEVAEGNLPIIYDKTLALKKGWTLVSVDKALLEGDGDRAWIGTELLAGDLPEETIHALKYTPTGGFVSEVTTADLEPLTAIYVLTIGGGGVGFNYPVDPAPTVYTKDLVAGWNLISVPSMIADTGDILSPLRYVTIGTQQVIGLTTLVNQGEYNQFSNSFYKATLTDGDWGVLLPLGPFEGYWASMEAADTFEVIEVIPVR